MDKLKLFEIWVNSGEWNGDNTEYIIARTEEEAIEKSHWYKWGKEREYTCCCWEMNGNKLLQNLLLSKYEENKCDVTFEIELKEKGHWTDVDSICPCCGEDKFKDLDADIWADWQPKYCPNCGAKMEKEV